MALEQGYDFLREAISLRTTSSAVLRSRPMKSSVSDGAKSDTGNIQEIFAQDVRVAIPDPVYPVYVDTNVDGRAHRCRRRWPLPRLGPSGQHRRQR